MGEFAVGASGEVLHALLGSCLGLALYDARTRTGGLAHIVLPDSKGETKLPAKFVDTAIPALIEAMEKQSGRRMRLWAKIAGGASMFKNRTAETVGTRNIAATEALLEEMKIPILARHLGGEKGRRMHLDLASGRVLIEIVGQEAVEL
ncbi:MAG: chemotaxis protein CheD [Planctomycetota bacterium]